MNISKALRIGIVMIPAIIWDVFYYCITVIYQVCKVIDERGAEHLDNFIEGK
jgi:hypothetical protein